MNVLMNVWNGGVKMGSVSKLLGLVLFLILLVLCFTSTGSLNQSYAVDVLGKRASEAPPLTSRMFQLDPGHEMRVLIGGSAPTCVVLIHGASKRSQNAMHWAVHFDWLVGLNLRVVAVDLLGHGDSLPGPAVETLISVSTQASAVYKLLQSNMQPSCQRYIYIARSYGADVLMHLLALGSSQPMPSALILIAPAVDPNRVRSTLGTNVAVLNVPTLIFWARNDPVIPYQRAQPLVTHFAAATLVTLPDINNKEQSRVHAPENELPDKFHEETEKFLNNFKLI